MSSTLLLIVFGLFSAACAYYAAQLAARQGRHPASWAFATFLLPALLLLLMKVQVEEDKKSNDS